MNTEYKYDYEPTLETTDMMWIMINFVGEGEPEWLQYFHDLHGWSGIDRIIEQIKSIEDACEMRDLYEDFFGGAYNVELDSDGEPISDDGSF